MEVSAESPYEVVLKSGGFDYLPQQQGLYDPRHEKDSCGVGMIADLEGRPAREIVENALLILENLDHRGARGCEVDTGDGAGMLCAMPDDFMRRVFSLVSVTLPAKGTYAIANVFLPRTDKGRQECKRLVEATCDEVPGLKMLGWRPVPVQSDCLGKTARTFEPIIEQLAVVATGPLAKDVRRFEAALYILRKKAENAARQSPDTPLYMCSLSSRVINYKGMLTCPGLARYFPDLLEEDFESHVALVHSRFSTNTFPSWRRAHPFRYICHNGEINTLRGNINAMRSREGIMRSDLLGPQLQECFPLVELDQTDSGIFDNVLEVLTLAGRSLPEAMVMMMPQAWENSSYITPELRDFFKYNASIMEPWDGPALVCFTDGSGVGASLDRNGLRPCRYYVTSDKKIILSSECGVLPHIDQSTIVKKGRLSPGKMLWADFAEGRLMSDAEVKQQLAVSQPWGKWMSEKSVSMPELVKSLSKDSPITRFDASSRGPALRTFGYTREALDLLLVPMGRDGEEALGSMGNDAPLACLSRQPRSVFDYFYQLFAQVTNPPIDPIRESVVMSVACWIGPEENVLSRPSSEHCHRLWLEHPCLLPHEFQALSQISSVFKQWRVRTLEATFPRKEGPAGLQRHLARLCSEAIDAVSQGCEVIVLSDDSICDDWVQLPSLLVCGAVHHALVAQKLRTKVALVIYSGDPYEVSHHALLLTFGADAVCPYMAYEALLQLREEGKLPDKVGKPDIEVFKSYQKAVGKGLLKIMAKMGVSTLRSYKGAQISDAIGLGREVVDMCFRGIASQLGGHGFEQLGLRILAVHERGYASSGGVWEGLLNEGQYHWREGELAEKHVNDPLVIAKLQEAARSNSRSAYASFAALHNSLVKATALRGQLDFKPPRQYGRSAIPLEAVEPASEIVKRFRTGAMSYGSISMEAHTTLAKAMNRIGGFSNTGEGGEDPIRYQPTPEGDSMKSAIKQVASGRFGVTMEYLSNAQELQIKMAQGAKPGEGGELPGSKVAGNIATTRCATEGVGLISPPPHHDIYSIEDLAQLIFDLKNSNPEAAVSVKLVSEVGVGVVAAGVAKCKADHILISGCDGGTGASKWTGIKHAGAPWEVGLAETHQTLVLNGLRGRVTLETDGQLRTGRDVMIAALLGAERFGFATAPLIAMGCIMMRKCHLNTCPVGIATQDPVLRKKFEGMPEHVVNYLMLVAEEVRVLLAKMGFRTIDDAIGCSEALRVDPSLRDTTLQFGPVLMPAHLLPDAGKIGQVERRKLYGQDHFMITQAMKDRNLLQAFKATFRFGDAAYSDGHKLTNIDRTLGTLLSHELYKRWGNSLPPGTCHAKLEGTSGQSFGAFALRGIFLELEGDSQDYFGKGLSGGTVVVYPPKAALAAGFKAEENIIIGNTALYGATSGVCFVRGIAAERFAVRNSGAWAVVEGTGDHCCEYMTGGRVVVLGDVGDNLAAGMSGGVTWIWDATGNVRKRVVPPEIDVSALDPRAPHPTYPQELQDLHTMLKSHVDFTGSAVAESILKRWPASAAEFTRLFPIDFMKAIDRAKEAGKPSPLVNVLDMMPKPGKKQDQPAATRPSRIRFPERTTSTSGIDIEDIAPMFLKGNRPKKVDDVEQVVKSNRGFMILDRAELPKRDKVDRTGDFQEILAVKDEVQIRTQAARCMDCGTPFCHQSVTHKSGCPLGNLIPEWNILISKGNWEEAFRRLMKTNNFPEFTGRVCPAPCEGACVLGIIDDPVGIKSVELSIIDKAYEMGWMKPMPPFHRTGKRVAIVGSGPAGLAAADQLNKKGHDVIVYERADRIGGLMMYGVPNMKADKVDVVQRRVEIMRQEGVAFVCGRAGHIGSVQDGMGGDSINLGPSAQELLDTHDAVLLATGATMGRDMQHIPGRELHGIHMAMDYLTLNTRALLDGGHVGKNWRRWWGTGRNDPSQATPIDAKDKCVVVIGGGDTGNDCIGTAVRQGATQVINLELMPQPPDQRAKSNPWPHWPMVMRTDYGHEEAALRNGGNDIREFCVATKEFVGDDNGKLVGMKVVSVRWDSINDQMRMVEVPGSERLIRADLIFLALGFTGPEHPLAEAFGVDIDRVGNYQALYQHVPGDFRTTNPKVFAAGDCRRGQSLVVWAIREGRDAAAAIERFLGDPEHSALEALERSNKLQIAAAL
mmetsp:Transcript_62362/g.174232  ORF Transcript_62362/g.174232 Transcript_62362/m.174232 type:complete len:2159 (-) Transcript_62362:60-6536(-)